VLSASLVFTSLTNLLFYNHITQGLW